MGSTQAKVTERQRSAARSRREARRASFAAPWKAGGSVKRVRLAGRAPAAAELLLLPGGGFSHESGALDCRNISSAAESVSPPAKMVSHCGCRFLLRSQRRSAEQL